MSGIRRTYIMTILLFCNLSAGVLVLVGCASPAGAQAKQSHKPVTSPTVRPHPETDDPTIAIDWVNFIHFQGITYISIREQKYQLPPSALGQVFDTIKFNVANNIHHLHYQLKDGDAAFLDPGTKVYTVKGYRSTFRLATSLDGKITVFEADTNPRAHVGADLLDIQGKVKAIAIRSADDGTTELGTIKDANQLANLVGMVESAPIKQDMSHDSALSCFIEFQLLDGSSTTRAFWIDTGEMSRGIKTPAAFGDVIKHICQLAKK